MNGDFVSSTLRNRIIQQVNQYIPGIILNSVNVNSIDENSISNKVAKNYKDTGLGRVIKGKDVLKKLL